MFVNICGIAGSFWFNEHCWTCKRFLTMPLFYCIAIGEAWFLFTTLMPSDLHFGFWINNSTFCLKSLPTMHTACGSSAYNFETFVQFVIVSFNDQHVFQWLMWLLLDPEWDFVIGVLMCDSHQVWETKLWPCDHLIHGCQWQLSSFFLDPNKWSHDSLTQSNEQSSIVMADSTDNSSRTCQSCHFCFWCHFGPSCPMVPGCAPKTKACPCGNFVWWQDICWPIRDALLKQCHFSIMCCQLVSCSRGFVAEFCCNWSCFVHVDLQPTTHQRFEKTDFAFAHSSWLSSLTARVVISKWVNLWMRHPSATIVVSTWLMKCVWKKTWRHCACVVWVFNAHQLRSILSSGHTVWLDHHCGSGVELLQDFQLPRKPDDWMMCSMVLIHKCDCFEKNCTLGIHNDGSACLKQKKEPQLKMATSPDHHGHGVLALQHFKNDGTPATDLSMLTNWVKDVCQVHLPKDVDKAPFEPNKNATKKVTKTPMKTMS